MAARATKTEVGSRQPPAFRCGAIPNTRHGARVGQTVVVPWSAPEGAIPLGPYVIVRLAPDLMSAL